MKLNEWDANLRNTGFVNFSSFFFIALPGEREDDDVARSTHNTT